MLSKYVDIWNLLHVVKASTFTMTYRLAQEGSRKIYAIVTHGVLSGHGIDNINATSAFEFLAVTNTIPQDAHCAACPALKVVP
jgi:phosphoribosylpyrophosphate synthetase